MKTSSYLAIAISIILVISIMFIILFAENVGIQDNHGNFRILEKDLQYGRNGHS
ncbi:hypothetical protein K0U27_08340 [archaeon]|nr:hypothetical protein [archaeon]